MYGEELFLLETSLKKIKTLFGECVKGINFINIDETNYQQLIADIETPAFGFEKKLIIAWNTCLLKKKEKKKADLAKTREKLANYLQNNIEVIKESVILVFVEEDADTKFDLYKVLDKNGIVCKFDFQKPLQIEKRLKGICKAYHVNIEDSTLMYLIECCGTNMQDLINETRKLIEFAGENGTIQKEDVDKLAIKKLESVIFDLTDNLGKKEIAKALEVLQNLIYAKEPLQKILITLYNHFKKLYFVKLALNTNKDIASSLNLKSNQVFLVNKYKAQVRYFQESELKGLLQKLRDLDNEYKIGLIDLQVGLESILCAYCS